MDNLKGYSSVVAFLDIKNELKKGDTVYYIRGYNTVPKEATITDFDDLFNENYKKRFYAECIAFIQIKGQRNHVEWPITMLYIKK